MTKTRVKARVVKPRTEETAVDIKSALRVPVARVAEDASRDSRDPFCPGVSLGTRKRTLGLNEDPPDPEE
jgi:hypothetical protein